jgi:signal transduction histidine kinase
MGGPEWENTSFSARKLCAYIAHELGNPLNGMLVSAEIIERYLESNPRAMDEIGDVLGSLRKKIKPLILLLKELQFCRVLVDINLQPTSLPAEIGELLALESAYYAQRRIRID